MGRPKLVWFSAQIVSHTEAYAILARQAAASERSLLR
jgi:hypothetical protein